MFSEKKLDNILSNLFRLKQFEIEWENVFISKKCEKEITTIYSSINKKTTKEEKIEYIKKLQEKKVKSDCINKSLNILSDIYNKK